MGPKTIVAWFMYFLLISVISATIDTSNVDFKNFKYFKHATSAPVTIKGYRYIPPEASPLQKAGAILIYFKNVFFGNPSHKQKSTIVFDPEFGKKWRPLFQKHYGYRGENLVALLGNGYSRKELIYYGAVGKKFEKF